MEIFKLSTYSKWNETHFFWKVLFLTIIGFVLAVGEVSAQTTTWVSMNSDGYDSEDRSDMPSISGDGRYVAFQSHSSLVPEDTTWYTDIYVYDLQAEQLSRVSVTPEGVSANGWNDDPWISANGRHVAFISTATNLIADDTNGYADIYVYDRETGLSHRVSIDSEGNQSNSHSSTPTTSFDGRYVAFTSGADNLVLDDTNGVSDVFVYDHTTGDMTRVSVDSEGNQGNMRSTSPSISADGRFVSFMSEASNLIPDDTNSRHEINQVVYFGLVQESNNTVLAESPLYKPEYQIDGIEYDIEHANRLLDELGLRERDDRGVRLLADGRPLEIVVQTAGESTEQTDVLELIHDSWLKAGIKLYSIPSTREVFRNRIFSGDAIMSIWTGLENGIPTAENSPMALAPTSKYQYQWPQWGAYYESDETSGEEPDLPAARELLALSLDWPHAKTHEERVEIWHRMLEINRDQMFSIGIVNHVPHPVVVSNFLHNVPQTGFYNISPGAYFGIYKPDTFWFDEVRR